MHANTPAAWYWLLPVLYDGRRPNKHRTGRARIGIIQLLYAFYFILLFYFTVSFHVLLNLVILLLIFVT